MPSPWRDSWPRRVLVDGCDRRITSPGEKQQVTDQLGRVVTVPRTVQRLTALHHYGGKIVYALGLGDRLVEQAIYGLEAAAISRVDPVFAARPSIGLGHSLNIEQLISLKPDVVFTYSSFDRSDMERIGNAGIPVIAVRGETLEESFVGVRLMAKVLDRTAQGEIYIGECERLLRLVEERLAGIPPEARVKVLFSGPKSLLTAASGEMLQNEILQRAGARNVAAQLKGFWVDVSPEQIAEWNPDVIFLGSNLNSYDEKALYSNSQFATISAVRTHRVYGFPSNVGWWDYPAPQCVLGVVWAAKTLYPERFADVDVLKIADEFYAKFVGHSFSELGGKL